MSVITRYKGAHTSYDDKPTPALNKIRDVASWADALEPRSTPLLTKIGKRKARSSRPFYWGQSVRTGIATTLASGRSANATTMAVAAGNYTLFKKWHMVAITNYVSGTNRLDPNSRAIVWLNADPTTDTITVVPNMAGTTDPVGGHLTGALVEIIGTAEPELHNHTIDPVTRGYQVSNDFQRFVGGVSADKRPQKINTYEHKSGNPMMADMENVQLDLKVQLEKSVLYNKAASAGVDAGFENASTRPSTLGGFRAYITTNAKNLGGELLSPYQIEDLARDQAKKIEGGGAKTMLMSYDTAAIWDTMLNPYRRADFQTTSMNLTLERVRLRWGTYEFGISHWIPDGEIWFLNFKDMGIVPFEGLDWHMKRHETDGDYDWISQSGDFSFMLENESRMAFLYNFNNDLDSYARKEMFG